MLAIVEAGAVALDLQIARAMKIWIHASDPMLSLAMSYSPANTFQTAKQLVLIMRVSVEFCGAVCLAVA